MNKNNNKRNTNNNKNRGGGRPKFNLSPPPYVSNLVVHKTFRFIATAAAAYPISPSQLCSLMVIGTTTNTSATMLFERVRLRCVEMWAAPATASLGTPVQISVAFSGTGGGTQGNDVIHSDTSIGLTRVAHVRAKPPIGTQTAQWSNGDTVGTGINTLFTVVVTVGTVIDVTVDLACTNDTRVANNTVVLTTVALSQLYYLALNNSAGAGASTMAPDASLITTT